MGLILCTSKSTSSIVASVAVAKDGITLRRSRIMIMICIYYLNMSDEYFINIVAN